MGLRTLMLCVDFNLFKIQKNFMTQISRDKPLKGLTDATGDHLFLWDPIEKQENESFGLENSSKETKTGNETKIT